MNTPINYERIQAAMEYIAANLTKQPDLKEIAGHVSLSEFHFQRIFKEWAGVSPKKFLQYLTLNELKKNIHYVPNLDELAEKVGLSAPSRVYDLFVQVEHVTPFEYKMHGGGILIEYGIHETPFGNCLIANTKKGICALEFLDGNEQEVILNFRQKWNNAILKENTIMAAGLVNDIFGNGKHPLNVLLYGTDFQIKVWEALLKIPFGQLCSYQSVARQIGNPSASRAVGSAIGRNAIAYLIPCHRVIQQLGGLGGYKWGLGRKLSLIGYEQFKNVSFHRNTLKSSE